MQVLFEIRGKKAPFFRACRVLCERNVKIKPFFVKRKIGYQAGKRRKTILKSFCRKCGNACCFCEIPEK
jgi:hypothetical protein